MRFLNLRGIAYFIIYFFFKYINSSKPSFFKVIILFQIGLSIFEMEPISLLLHLPRPTIIVCSYCSFLFFVSISMLKYDPQWAHRLKSMDKISNLLIDPDFVKNHSPKNHPLNPH